MTSTSAITKLVMILFFGLMLRVVFLHGIAPGDPFTYSATAWDIVQGRWNPAYFYEQTTRWGVLFPLAASYRWFGVNDVSSLLWPLLTSLGTVLVAFLLASHLRGERAALLAGLLVAIFPLEIIYATQPMADCPLSFWLLLSLYCFVRAEHSDQRKRGFYVFSGIALALAYATKFVAVLVAPFFLLVLLWRRRIEWNWLWLVLGFLLVVGVEGLLFQRVSGNGLLRLQLVLHDQASHAPVTAGGFQVHNGAGMYLYWMLVDCHYVGLSFVALLLLLVQRLVRYWRTRQPFFAESRSESWLPMLWGLTLLLMLSVYPVSIKPYIALYKIEVYMLMFTAPLLVLTAVWLSEQARRWQIIGLALIVLSTLPFVYLLHESYRAHADNARAIFAFAQAHPDRPVYAHRSDQRYLQYFAGFQQNDRYQSFRLPRPGEDVHSTPPINFHQSYVAINHYLLNYHREDRYPPEIQTPPTSWREVYRYQRPEHWLRRVIATATKPLSPNLAQAIQRKFANWSHTQPVSIDSVE